MNNDYTTARDLYQQTDTDADVLTDPEIAHLIVNEDQVLGMHGVPGLNIKTEQIEQGLYIDINLKPQHKIEKPVHLCFGMLPEKGTQRIEMKVNIGDHSSIAILAHCVFPRAVEVKHIMNAEIVIGENAVYRYQEKHVHSDSGGVEVIPKARIVVGKSSRFSTEFVLLKGRVGIIDVDYSAEGLAHSVIDMNARISGLQEDVIKINEQAYLHGEHSTAVLTSKIAVRDRARAEIKNKIVATAPYARGHVDCKEIVQDQGVANAVPIVEVAHPKAHVTHEAAIGSVDNKQLETLMSRGISEDEGVEMIIQGLLSK